MQEIQCERKKKERKKEEQKNNRGEFYKTLTRLRTKRMNRAHRSITHKSARRDPLTAKSLFRG